MAVDAIIPETSRSATQVSRPAVVGLIRFSFLSDDPDEYRQTRGADLGSRARHVLDPARLERRLALFEAICLPSLAAQPKDKFAAIVLTSVVLPARYRERLGALLATHTSLSVVYSEPASSGDAFSDAMAALAPTAGPRLTFRLDDDDAIPADYTDRALSYCTPVHAGHCLSFYAGWGIGRVLGQVRVWPRRQPMASAGLAYISGPGEARTIYDCGDHQSIAERFPTILDGRRPGFLQSAHRGNDSGGRIPWQIRVRPARALSLAQATAKLGAAFPLLDGPSIERL